MVTMKARCIGLCVSFISSITATHALELDVSPQANGTLAMHASHTLAWNDSLWSSLSLSVENPLEVDEGEGRYVATSGTIIEGSLDVLGYRFKGPLRLGLAINALYSPMSLKEVGYIDLAGGGRLFLVNERSIDLLLPRLKVSLAGEAGPLSLSLEGEVSPYYIVNLTQRLSTSTGGVPTAKTLSSPGFGSWAASGDASLRLAGTIIAPELRVGLDSVPMAYSYLNASGQEAAIDSLIVTVRAMAGAGLPFLARGGAVPRALVGYEWNKVQDRPSGTWIAESGDILVLIGFSL